MQAYTVLTRLLQITAVSVLLHDCVVMGCNIRSVERRTFASPASKATGRQTRQHSYRKEDRAMRPIYGCT